MLMKSKENETAMQKLCLDHVTSFKYRTDFKTWRRIDSKDAVLGFPVLTEDDVRQMPFGVYQIKQANSYVAEHLKNGHYHIDVSEMETNLLHAKIQYKQNSVQFVDKIFTCDYLWLVLPM